MPIANSNHSYMQIDSRRRVQGLLHRNRTVAHRTASYRDARNSRQEAKRVLEAQHPDFVAANAGKRTADYIIAFSIVAVALIDMLLFGALAEFLVRLGFNGNEAMILAAKIVLPFLVVWLELKVATQLAMEQEKHIEGMGKTRQYWLYLFFAIVIVSIMTAISLTTTLAIRNGAPAGARLSFDVMAFGLAALAFAAHGLVLFGGQSANQAMAHVVFNVQRRHIANGINRYARRYQQEADQLSIIMTNYMNSFTDHNARYLDAPVTPGPFDRVTREIVNEVFGYEVIQPMPMTPGDSRVGMSTGTMINPPAVPVTAAVDERAVSVEQPQEAPGVDEPVFSREAEDEVRV